MPASSSSRTDSISATGASRVQVVRAWRALDALNFFLADVRGGLGPYLAIYLLTVRNWNEAEIGIVMSISAIAGILAETPGGALIDAIRAKRAAVVLAALVVTAGSLLLPFLSTFLAVALSQATVSAVGSIFGPAIAAISLGIVGHAYFARRTGRNEAFNHAGNAFAAAVAGGAAYVWGPSVVFFLIAAMAVASLPSVLTLPAAAIDYDRARGLHDGATKGIEQPSWLPSPADMPPSFALCRMRSAISLCQRGNASARWSEARTPRQEFRHLPNVSLHRRGANHNGPNGDIGRTQG